MGRYVRVAQASAPAPDGGIDWGEVLGTGLGAAGSAGKLAGGLGGSGALSMAGSGLGGLGSLAGGIASGDPVQSLLGAGQAASGISGLAGGPTITSGLTGLTGLSAGALATVAAPFVATAIAGMSGDSEGLDLFGGEQTQAQKQVAEHKGYRDAWPGLVQRRQAGADLFGQDYDTPEDVTRALGTAASGIRATDLSPAYSHLAQNPYVGDKSKNAAKIPGMDMSGWEDTAPGLEGQNWGSFLGLMDKGYGLGLDTGAMAGGKNKTGAGYGEEAISLTDNLGDLGGAYTGPLMRSTAGDERQSTTQEAYDLSNSIAGIGQQLGIDWGSRGDSGRNQGYEVAPDELDKYGFTGGNYGAATLGYLKSLDPSIAEGDKWDEYTSALGVTDEDLAGLPSLSPFRNKTPNYNIIAPDLNLGGM